MKDVSKYTEEMINSYLLYSEEELSVSEYLLFRQQAINELTNKKLISKNNMEIPLKKTVDEQPVVQNTIQANKNSSERQTIKTISINNSTDDDIESEERTSSKNFWDIINRIED